MIVEFSSPLCDSTLYLVATSDEGKSLLADGVTRGRIWSPKEIEALKAIPAEDRRAVVELKVQFDARVQDVVKHHAD